MLFSLCTGYYKNNNYREAVKYYYLLSSQFPSSPYAVKARKDIIDSNYKFAIELLEQKEYHKSYKQLDKIVKGYSLSSSMKELVGDYMSENLYNIGLAYYKAEEYYLATEVFDFLIKHFSKSKKYKDARFYLEESYFRDGKRQSERQAYSNAIKVFKVLLTRFPNGKYTLEARSELNKINIKGISTKENTLNSLESLIDKGNSINNPYSNEDVYSLFKMLNKEKAKNPEYLQRKVFPLYYKKYVNLENISILKYERLSKKGFLTPKARKLIDGFLDRKAKDKEYKNFEYAIYSNTPNGKLIVVMSSNSFFKIDFSKGIRIVSIRGRIFKFELKNNEIIIYIFLSTLKQD